MSGLKEQSTHLLMCKILCQSLRLTSSSVTGSKWLSVYADRTATEHQQLQKGVHSSPRRLICLCLRNEVCVSKEWLFFICFQPTEVGRVSKSLLGENHTEFQCPQNVKSKQLCGQRLAIVVCDFIKRVLPEVRQLRHHKHNGNQR